MNADPDKNPTFPEVRKWLEAALRYNFLINAGGAIATLGFMGATWQGTPVKLPIIPLSFFTLGIIASGIAINGQFLSAVRDATKGRLSDVPPWLLETITRADLIASGGATVSFLSFIVGALAGVGLLIAY